MNPPYSNPIRAFRVATVLPLLSLIKSSLGDISLKKMEPIGGSILVLKIILPDRSMTSAIVIPVHWLGNAITSLESDADHATIGRRAEMTKVVSFILVVVSLATTGSIQSEVFCGLVGCDE